MNEYRLSVDDDELDDYEEGAEMSVEDEMGDFGIDEEDEDDLPVPAAVGVIPPAAMIISEVEVVPIPETPPARKPAVKAAKPAAKKAAPKKAVAKKAVAKKAAPRKAAKKAAPRKSAKKAASKKKAAKKKK